MALTIVGQPNQVHPGFNPIVYYIDSTNKNLPAFRYIVQIFDAGTANLLREFKIAPRPVDGYGYIDISKIIQNKLSSFLNLSSTTYNGADNYSAYNYDIKFGEEYTAGQTTTTTQPITIAPNPTTYAQVFFSASHPFVAGDQVFIQLATTYGDCRDGLNGYHTILSVGAPDRITLNYITSCTTSQSIAGGVVSYADNRKTRTLNLASLNNRVAFNAAYEFADFINYNQSNIILGSSGKQILTNAPRTNFKIHEWQKLFWNFFDNKQNKAKCILFKNDSGDLFRMSTSSGSYYIKQVNVSPSATLSILSGIAPLVKATTKYYDVWSSEFCDCDYDCDVLDITYDIGAGDVNIQTTFSGTYNGAKYYKIGSYYLWYSIANTWWEVTSALGGGNQYLISNTAASTCPPIGEYGVEWFDGANPLFIDFETFACSPEFIKSSETIRIYIDDRCPINQTQLLFLDRKGSFSSFAFTLKNKKSGNVERTSYRKEFGNLSGGAFTYNTYDSGEINFNITNDTQYELNTDWMSDEMSVYFEELYTSPEIYVQFETSGNWYRCNLLENSYKVERSKNKKLIRYTVNIKLSVNNNINI